MTDKTIYSETTIILNLAYEKKTLIKDNNEEKRIWHIA